MASDAMTPPDEVNELWDTSDVMKFGKVSKQWVSIRVKDKSLHSVKVFGARRFIPAFVKKFFLTERSEATEVVRRVLPIIKR